MFSSCVRDKGNDVITGKANDIVNDMWARVNQLFYKDAKPNNKNIKKSVEV